MKNKRKTNKHKHLNPVAKYSPLFNKPSVQPDKSKKLKTRKQKHKHKEE